MAEPKVYVLRIMEGSRCVAEAPLIVHDKAAAQRCWVEGFPQIAHGIVGCTFQMVLKGCADQEPTTPLVGVTIIGAHSGLQVVKQMPSSNGAQEPV